MAEYTSEKIKELIAKIQAGRIVLPAMQRNFVWPEEKIYDLFDSLMHDYPIGTFLFWDINSKEEFDKYYFNTFISNYDEAKGKLQRGNRATANFSDYQAVLDGQQRITSLYIGIIGKWRAHIKGKDWSKDSSFYDKFLAIDILNTPKTDDDKYSFLFVTNDVLETMITESSTQEFWVPVSKLFDDDFDVSDYIDSIEKKYPSIMNSIEIRKPARKALEKLKDALLKAPNVNYYLAKEKKLTEVVEIFVRVNSGGQKLDSSDLMLSVAAGEQEGSDIHQNLQEAIDEINNNVNDYETGYKIDKQTFLTAGLMLTGADSLSLKKPENWSPSRMNEIFKDHWDAIVEALKCSVNYLEHLGFNGKKLTSKNLLLPIAYYFYKNQLNSNHKNSTSHRACCDRIFIRQWLMRAMMNSVFSDGTGATLVAMRSVMSNTNKDHFPLEDLMQKPIKRPLLIGEEQIEEILDLKYGDSRIKPLFLELTKKASDINYQEDHIWAKSILSSKKEIRKYFPIIYDDEIVFYKNSCNKLANLELLDRVENQLKSDSLFDVWINTAKPDENERSIFYTEHFIPSGINCTFDNLREFFEERNKLLKEKIAEAFPDSFDDIVKRYNLSDKLK